MSDIENQLKALIAMQFGLSVSKLNNSDRFMADLGLDSLDAVELVMAIEEEFDCEIPDEKADTIITIQDMVDYLSDDLSIVESSDDFST